MGDKPLLLDLLNQQLLRAWTQAWADSEESEIPHPLSIGEGALSPFVIEQLTTSLPGNPEPSEWKDVQSEYQERGHAIDLAKLRELVFQWNASDKPIPYSPLAIARLLSTFGTTRDRLATVFEDGAQLLTLLNLSAQTVVERALIRELLVFRVGEIVSVLGEAEEELEEAGWRFDSSDHRLYRKTGSAGRPSSYPSDVIAAVYEYLRPKYREAFSDSSADPAVLRRQISSILSPFFDPSEVDPAPKGPISNAIRNRRWR